MTERQTIELEATLKIVAAKAKRLKGRGIGEQNTKASLIEPILEALGWDIREPDEVHREFKPTSKDSPVDYALKILKKPRLFVEAKGLDENLSDRKWIAQVLGYATVAGVEWCVLSDGDEYRFYNATAALDAEEKLFCRLRLSEVAEAEAAKTLSMISRSNMEDNLLEVLWAAHFVDRQVRETLRALIDSADARLVRLVRSIAIKLTPKEIADSIRRLDIQIDPPAQLPSAIGGSRAPAVVSDVVEPPSRSDAAKRAWETRRSNTASELQPLSSATEATEKKRSRTKNPGTLRGIIAAGLLKPPVKLYRSYKGTSVEATLFEDGSVEFNGTRYRSASSAAESARLAITGEKKNTSGWWFWQYSDAAGKKVTLEQARELFNAQKK